MIFYEEKKCIYLRASMRRFVFALFYPILSSDESYMITFKGRHAMMTKNAYRICYFLQMTFFLDYFSEEIVATVRQ